MYTDLAMLYERAGKIKGKNGSITQVPILSMPGDDITHPIPDLSGYITEGQIVADRGIHMKGIYPPINVSASLSRLMNAGIGPGMTREDHKAISDQLYAAYAEGKDLRGLVAIVGKEALSESDRKFLEFADLFEDRFVRQGANEDRSIEDTLDLSWELIASLPEDALTRIDRKFIEKYHPAHRNKTA
jgi:V/A-type H+-transporting ATPase subunit B